MVVWFGGVGRGAGISGEGCVVRQDELRGSVSWIGYVVRWDGLRCAVMLGTKKKGRGVAR